MLVRITNRCHMGCPHCMVRATPDGEHMSRKTFAKVMDFVERYPFEILMISGGEPLEHPDFFEMVEEAKDRFSTILILSNGSFADDDALLKKVMDLKLPFQITNDPKFYPKRIKKIDWPFFAYEDALRVITKLGRAKDNNLEMNRLSPLCFNLRSASRSLRQFEMVLIHLRQACKFCTPSINVDGSVVAGESPGCYKIGDVESTDMELIDNLLAVKCNKCGLEDGLEDMYRQAIGLPEVDVWTMPII